MYSIVAIIGDIHDLVDVKENPQCVNIRNIETNYANIITIGRFESIMESEGLSINHDADILICGLYRVNKCVTDIEL